jgi:adenine-specific DNA methylase
VNPLVTPTAETLQLLEFLDRAGAISLVDAPDGARLVANGDLSDVHGSQLLYEVVQESSVPLFGASLELAPYLLLPGGARVAPDSHASRDSRTGAHIRSVLAGARVLGPHMAQGDRTVQLAGSWQLSQSSAALAAKAQQAASSFANWTQYSQTDFANSASYMGSKRAILPFLMQMFDLWLPKDTIFIDLMCGSGSVSGASARQRTTIASDAQEFCVNLAGVQSGGFSSDRAVEVLEYLQEPMTVNMSWLRDHLSDLLEAEQDLFQSASLDLLNVATKYSEFIANLPTYPMENCHGNWHPAREVATRRSAPAFSRPSCLFTAYYADLYFGVQQAIELDSVRHAIAELPDPVDRRWALGALVVAASRIATGYGGHFAQPRATPAQLLDAKFFSEVVSLRSRSLLQEFEKRLLILARESDSTKHVTQLVDGPWQSAISEIADQVDPKNVTVYVDAPYRREEYSRYYHLLETLVRYDYPHVTSKGRVRDKSAGYRVRSEFFTRNRPRMTQALASVLEKILWQGWNCAWSYADNADASVGDVLASLASPPRRIRTASADHAHRLQGDHERPEGLKGVRELLIFLEP